MKRFLFILTALLLALFISGCTEVLPGQAPETPTPDQATREQDIAFRQALNGSISTITPLRDRFSRNLREQDWTAVAISAADLGAATEQQYAEMSRFSVSPEVHEIQADYLRALQDLNLAAEEGSNAVVAATGGNPDLAAEHSGRAEAHLRDAASYLDLATGAMKLSAEKSGSV